MSVIEQRRQFAIFLAVSLAATGTVSVGCAARKAAPRAPDSVPVTVSRVENRDVPVEVRVIGHVEASSSVSVRPRVGGEIVGVLFREGQDVKAGDRLFSIDPRTYQADLNIANANLERDRARASSAEKDASRYADLVKKDYVTKEQEEQARANAAALAATVKADEALVESAALQLGYTSIKAPVSGRVGSLLVHSGNLVKANDDRPLVVINQIRPILATFAVPEVNLPEVQSRQKAGMLKVLAAPQGDVRPSAGTLSFIDNTIDATTGTVVLKASFPNDDGALWPGQYVNVSLTLSVDRDALVIPSAAVQLGQKGNYVYVVKDDLTVEARPIVVSRSSDGIAVLSKGLHASERVVTDGQLRLSPGARVDIQERATASK